jgi:hypothetical protein
MNYNEWFYYDESSPSKVRWKIKREIFKPYYRLLNNIGDVAGKQDKKGYWVIDSRGLVGASIKSKMMCHRVVCDLLELGDLTGNDVDHIDGDPSNNSPSNLKVCSRSENCRNRRKLEGKIGQGVSVCIKKHPPPHDYKTTKYYLARYTDSNGVRRNKHFSVVKYGEELALQMAKEYWELHSKPEGYTERHGK